MLDNSRNKVERYLATIEVLIKFIAKNETGEDLSGPRMWLESTRQSLESSQIELELNLNYS